MPIISGKYKNIVIVFKNCVEITDYLLFNLILDPFRNMLEYLRLIANSTYVSFEHFLFK